MNAKNPLLIAVVAVVLAGFGFYHFALQPKHQEAADLKAKVTAANDRLDAARTLLAANLAAKREYRSSYATVVRLGKAVPGDDDVRSLVVQLDQAAKRTHVAFQGIQVGGSAGSAAPATDAAAGATLPPGATIGPAGFPVMPFSFTFKGGFFRLAAFFARLDRFVSARNQHIDVSGRLLTIDGVQLKPAPSGFPNIEATVNATSYLVSPLEGATGGATAAGPQGATPAPGAPGSTGGSTAPVTTTATSTGVIR